MLTAAELQIGCARSFGDWDGVWGFLRVF
jgi:hypothetical protein